MLAHSARTASFTRDGTYGLGVLQGVILRGRDGEYVTCSRLCAEQSITDTDNQPLEPFTPEEIKAVLF